MSHDSDSSCETNVRASRWPCPRRSTTPQGVRGKNQGREVGTRRTRRPSSGENPLPSRSSSSCTRKSPGGSRPPCLGDPRGPQERIQGSTVDQFGDLAPMVQILDAPVPQTVDQLVDAFRHIDIPLPEQVMEVPKLSCPARPHRLVLPVTQMVEQ